VTPLAALRGQLPRRWQLVGAVYGIRDWLVVATEPDGVTDAPEPGAAALTAAGVAWDAWRTARRGPHAIRARQRERLAALVGHARRKSRFYAELYRDLPPDAVELAGLPPTTKSALMARFDDWVTDPEVTRSAVESFVADPNNLGAEFLDRYLVFTTSGSTGVPALLVQDKRALAVMTGLAYGRSATAVTPGLVRRTLGRGVRLAAIFATGGHFLTTTMFEHRQRLVPARRRVARFFSVQDPLPRLVEQLNAYQPTLIASYPSVLSVLADERLAGRLRLDPIMIVSGGELLPRTVRRRISSAFGCPVSETYSASEATPLAVPCRLGRLHVNADWFILEPMDATGAPVPAGQRSHSVLVTNLANYVQPIIRYDLGDSVVMDRQPCACDNPLPTIRVEGRTDEIIEMPRADGQPVALLPMALATVVEETPGVLRFQIVHTAPSTLAVRLQADPGSGRGQVWAAVRARLSGYLADQGLPAVGLELAAELPVPVAGSGKLRHVIRADAVAVQSGDVSSPDP
jgi:phenylacetate-coenzyme A ligase PaaK-like adenylate-forming protein